MTQGKPLAGFKVVDFSAVFAGPICTRFLVDCGAEVIKIEPPGAGDMIRGIEGTTRVFAHFNAGKKSVALDLKLPEARQLALQLVANADVVVENFRPGIMARFGLDYASLREQYPDLVYCSISGYGQSGPLAGRAAFAPIVHAASGFDHVVAQAQEQDSARPINWNIMVADILTGAYAFGAIQTALLNRERNGGGDFLDVAMMDAMMLLIPAQIQAAQMKVKPPIARYCPMKTSDGFVMACVISDKNMQGLCEAIERPELAADPRFVPGQRIPNMRALIDEMETWSCHHTAVECEEILNAAGVPCSVYVSPDELFAHPQVVARQSFTSVSDDSLGDFVIQNMPFKFTRFNANAYHWAPSLGEHTTQVLSEELQLEEQAISRLQEQGAIARL